MNTHPQPQLHQHVIERQSRQSTKPMCPVCGQLPFPCPVAQALARIWANDLPAIRSDRAQRLAPTLAWLRGGVDLEAASKVAWKAAGGVSHPKRNQ